ncbi:MAG: Tm-1-like ATP-binding domain-containing protein, partial [Candidatus Humimicrobiaceae bacterium]
LNKEEMTEVGREVVERLEFTEGEAFFMVPMKGFDRYAIEGEGFYDPEADRAFIEELKSKLRHNIKIVEVNTHIEDLAFIEYAFKNLVKLLTKRQKN